MPIIIVEVMPKAELLDPQGKAVAGALARTGASRFTGARIGKRFELSFDGTADDSALAEARELADSLLSNSVIEDVVSVHFAPDAGPVDAAPTDAAPSVAAPTDAAPSVAGPVDAAPSVASLRHTEEPSTAAAAPADDSLDAVPNGHA